MSNEIIRNVDCECNFKFHASKASISMLIEKFTNTRNDFVCYCTTMTPFVEVAILSENGARDMWVHFASFESSVLNLLITIWNPHNLEQVV